MVAVTLAGIDAWYAEPTTAADRPTLLSKLALLELCGWIECELDELVRKAERGRLNDAQWVEKNVVKGTHGFEYTRHFRNMLVKVTGEIFVRRIETELERANPGALAQLTSMLDTLYRQRCSLAHTNIGAAVPRQVTYQAPSVTVQTFNRVQVLLMHYEAALDLVLAGI